MTSSCSCSCARPAALPPGSSMPDGGGGGATVGTSAAGRVWWCRWAHTVLPDPAGPPLTASDPWVGRTCLAAVRVVSHLGQCHGKQGQHVASDMSVPQPQLVPGWYRYALQWLEAGLELGSVATCGGLQGPRADVHLGHSSISVRRDPLPMIHVPTLLPQVPTLHLHTSPAARTPLH